MTSLELHNQLKKVTPPKGRRKPAPPSVAAITAYLSACNRVVGEYNGKEYRWRLKSNGKGKKK